MSGIYKGYNPIFESFKREIFEQENKIDLDALDRAIYDTFVRTILGGSNQDIKTPEGFKNYIEGTLTKTSNFDALQLEMLKKFDERIKEEPGQKQALSDLKTYLTQLFTSLKPAIGNDAAAFKGLLDKMSDYSKATIGDLQKLKSSLQEKEDLVSKYLTEQRTGEEDKSEDGVNDYKGTSSFSTYKNLADEAISFNGEMVSAISNSKLSANPDVQKFAAMATKFLADTQKLAITKDGNFLARVKTSGEGKINRKQYREKCASIHNDIIRQREEWHKVLGQLTNVPPPTAIVCTVGQIWDKNLKTCVVDPNYVPASTSGNAGSSGSSSTSGNAGNPIKKKSKKGSGGSSGSSAPCTFPVSKGASACDDIKKLQTKISGIGSCVDDILRSNGGIDGLYGKTTAKLTSIIYSYLSGSSDDPKDSIDLSKEIFDKIMSIKLHESYIYKIEDKSFNSILEKNLFVKEYETGNPVISFSDFSKVLEQSSTSKKSFADCVCETFKTGKISSECKNVKPTFGGGGSGSTGKDGGSGSSNEGVNWKGLKPAQSGLYLISYDQSTGAAALEVTAVTVGVTAIVLSAGAALAAIAPVGLEATAAGAAFSSATLAAATSTGIGSTLAGAGAIASAPIAIGTGVTSAALTERWGGRDTVGISTVAGFISRTGMKKIVRGMTNTTDGYVGHKDLTAIMATLCLLKGTWTTNASRDKALSGWGEFKRLFAKENKIDIKSEINKITTATVKDCKDFPDFDGKDLSEGDTLNAEDARQTILEAIDRLDKNESDIESNIRDITADDIDKVYEGTKLSKKGGGSENKETEEKTSKKVGL